MKKITWILAAFMVLLSACNSEQEYITDESSLEDAFLSGKALSGEEGAVQVVNNFINSMKKESVDTRSVISTKVGNISKKSIYDYSGDERKKTRSPEDDLTIYEITLDNEDNTQGFALVADENAPSLIAFTPTGSVADTLTNKGLAIWFTMLKEDHEAYVEAKKEAKTRADYVESNWITYSLWGYCQDPRLLRTLGTSSVRTDKFYEDIHHEIHWDRYSNQARINTKWHQGSPYNDYCAGNMYGGGKCSIGCFPIAASQIIAYHGKLSGFGFDFAAMTSSPNVTPGTNAALEAGLLNFYIADKAGTSYNRETGAGSTNASAVVPTFQKLNYNIKVSHGEIDPVGFGSSILLGRPYMIGGQSVISSGGWNSYVGHIWICDGLYHADRWHTYSVEIPYLSGGKQYYRYDLYMRLEETTLYHMVWGNGGSSDGWYYTFKPRFSSFNYTHDLYYFYEIYPK